MKALILKQLFEFWRRKYLVLLTFAITSIYPFISIFKEGVTTGNLLFISVCLTVIFQTMASSQIQDEIANGFFALMHAYPLRSRDYIESKFIFFTVVSIGILILEIILLLASGLFYSSFSLILVVNLILYIASLFVLSFYFRGSDKNPFLMIYEIVFIAFIFSQTFSMISAHEMLQLVEGVSLSFILGIGVVLSFVAFVGTRKLATRFFQEARL